MTELDEARGDNAHRQPRFLPDGRRFLYLARNKDGSESHVVMVGSLDDDTSRELLRSPVAASYASGYLLFLRGQALMAQRFDTKRLILDGEATLVAPTIRSVLSAVLGVFAASENGELVYLRGAVTIGTEAQMELVDRTGRSLDLLGDRAEFESGYPSPDGRRFALAIFDSAGTYDLWIHDIERDTRTRFTFDPGSELYPVWSPDGTTLVYRSIRKGGRHDLFRKTVGGLDEKELLLESTVPKMPSSWSPDGKHLAFFS